MAVGLQRQEVDTAQAGTSKEFPRVVSESARQLGAAGKGRKRAGRRWDYAEFGQLLIEIHQVVVGPLAERENKVAAALDSLNKAALQDEEADD